MCGYCNPPEQEKGEDIFDTIDEELAHRDGQLDRIERLPHSQHLSRERGSSA